MLPTLLPRSVNVTLLVCSVTPQICAVLNGCNHHGRCDIERGGCVCDEGFTGLCRIRRCFHRRFASRIGLQLDADDAQLAAIGSARQVLFWSHIFPWQFSSASGVLRPADWRYFTWTVDDASASAQVANLLQLRAAVSGSAGAQHASVACTGGICRSGPQSQRLALYLNQGRLPSVSTAQFLLADRGVGSDRYLQVRSANELVDASLLIIVRLGA